MSAAAQFALAMAVTFFTALPLRRLALCLGLLDRPGPRKLQVRPVPYLGGAAVLLGLVAGAALRPGSGMLLVVLAGAQAVGLLDDVHGAGPGVKLVAQVGLAIAAVASGLTFPLTHLPALDEAITVVWLVGMANAFNLLDNMDGLCGAVTLVAALGLALVAPESAALALPLAGAAAGFVLLNLPPARMYLGDAGSMTIGFAVGICTVQAASNRTGVGSLLLLVLPVAVAVLDTSVVIVSRLLAGRPVYVGGLDHLSHRLRRLGWDDRRILLVTALAAAAGPLAAWASTRYPEPVTWLAALVVAGFVAAWLLLLLVLDPHRPAPVRAAGSIRWTVAEAVRLIFRPAKMVRRGPHRRRPSRWT